MTDDNGIFAVELIEEDIITHTRVCYDIGRAVRESSLMLKAELEKRRIPLD